MRFKNIPFCLLIIGLGITCLFSCTTPSQNVQNANHSDSAKTAHLLTERIFFLLHEIENTPALRNTISKSSSLEHFFNTKKETVTQAVEGCEDMDCLVKALTISKEENHQLISDLSELYHAHSAVKDFMRNKIRPTHAYILHSN